MPQVTGTVKLEGHETYADFWSRSSGHFSGLRLNAAAWPGSRQPGVGHRVDDDHGKGTKTSKKTTPLPRPTMPGLGSVRKLLGEGGQNMAAELVTQAYGTKLPQRRDPDKPDDE